MERFFSYLIAAKQHLVICFKLDFVYLFVFQQFVDPILGVKGILLWLPQALAHVHYKSMIMICYYCISKTALFAWSSELL